MKIKLEELKKLVQVELAEAKKKAKKAKDADPEPAEYKTDENFDFSAPQGAHNRYRAQGASNIGPFTAENALRLFVRECIRESVSDVISEKHIGFKKLKNMLAKKGVNDPAALAASIGRKKYGSSGMAAKAAAGKKKK